MIDTQIWTKPIFSTRRAGGHPPINSRSIRGHKKCPNKQIIAYYHISNLIWQIKFEMWFLVEFPNFFSFYNFYRFVQLMKLSWRVGLFLKIAFWTLISCWLNDFSDLYLFLIKVTKTLIRFRFWSSGNPNIYFNKLLTIIKFCYLLDKLFFTFSLIQL